MKEGTITIGYSNYSCDIDRGDGKIIPSGTQFISLSFWGYNEGQSGGCDSEEELKRELEYLISKYNKTYKLKIIDERIKEKQMTL